MTKIRSHKQRRERRRQIAEFIRNHPKMSRIRLAERYGVSVGTIRRCIIEANIDHPSPPRKGSWAEIMSAATVGRLKRSKRTQAEIASGIHCHQSRVSDVLTTAREHGLI